MIDPKQVVEGQRIQRESEKCKHPTHEIRDLPDRSYCKACGEDVAPLMRHTVTGFDFGDPRGDAGVEMDVEVDANGVHRITDIRYLGRTKPSVFPVFPSGGE